MTEVPENASTGDSTPATWPSEGTTSSEGDATSAMPAVVPAAPVMPSMPCEEPPRPQTSTSAIIALVLSIVSWVFCPLITAIIAIVLAYQADKEIRNSSGRVTGQGLSFAAMVIAWINIGVSVALIVLAVVFGLVLLVAGGFGTSSA